MVGGWPTRFRATKIAPRSSRCSGRMNPNFTSEATVPRSTSTRNRSSAPGHSV
jgi:hypothetical protein